MGNVIRYISGEELNRAQASQNFARPPEWKDEEKQTDASQAASQYLPVKPDPYRAKFLQIIDPNLRQLRASILNPEEAEFAERSLMELLLDWAERKLELGR